MQPIRFSLRAASDGNCAFFPFYVDGVPVPSDGIPGGLSCAISLRSAGDMGFDPERPNPNRGRLFSELALDPGRVVARRQTHSRDVLAVGAGRAAVLPPGDGLASSDPTLVLSVTAADCLPVYLADLATGSFAVAHSGWKGTGISAAALSLMRERWGTKPEDVAAVLGPCIRGCCYEVDAGRAAAFEDEFGRVCEGRPLGPAVRRENGRCFIDLQAANAALLESAGVRNIAVCTDCTFTDDRLGSFRREGADRFTRMVAFLGRLP